MEELRNNGSSAKIVDSILIEGMNIKANPDFRSNRILLFVEKYKSCSVVQ